MNITASSATNTGETLPSRKRPRPDVLSDPPNHDVGLNVGAPPKLPKVDCELLLEAYTHKSLRKPVGDVEDRLCDNERLAVLGKSVIGLVITGILYKQKPRRDAEEIEVELAQLLHEVEWAQMYGMVENIRCHPNSRDELHAEETVQTVFRAFTGAAFISSGLESIEEWIEQLLQTGDDPDAETTICPPQNHTAKDSPPHKKARKSELASPQVFFASQPSRKPLDPAPSIGNPLTPAQPNLPFLPSFHQAASRRGVSVTYTIEHAGPNHSGQWIAQCLVNGILKGMGSGGNKQAAKEAAARKAYYAMGWT
ncbi:hypothetical protein BDN71DRAFT_1500607 [Pleurotus eryngii]|uniref:Uncharacterized protein n=1 Tax=Pleurotus eryngii TaxID=5323 RepID=A0A9P6A9M3_PLEER|nr:hypothetical protein BDN71DRAFT_1500607 [Pleurotus eryngii]